ncbi:hypothetical protein JW921_10605 [Candidatus Fermentibacterales bacterium]|nr:hypothetical protein [Candidatus Fermentibacterales bacterium]
MTRLPNAGFRARVAAALVPVLLCSIAFAQARIEQGRLILEEITIRGELRTPQALFIIMKSTPNLSNVLLERSFLEDVVRPIYPDAFGEDPMFSSGEPRIVLPWWLRYGTVAAFGGLSVYGYTSGSDEESLAFGVIAGLGLVGNLILDLVGD